MTNSFLCAIVMLAIVAGVQCFCAAGNKSADRLVSVDGSGILRWQDTGDEVAIFGVNYTVPFAYSYRALGYLGISHERAIDQDINHFARMGLDAFRLHVWDREISDHDGNLLDNDHLRLLDYLILKLKERGIYSVITPIAWWGSGYPEPDPPTPGFSNLYSKAEMCTDSSARRAQRNYIKQFVRHINRYTGFAYKDDPAIIAFEVINEPHNPPREETAREYIDDMYQVFRDAGCRKPLFYCVSQGMSPGLVAAVSSSRVEGCTFGWYPTGLVGGRTFKDNPLPYLEYPQMSDPKLAQKAKLVYEFDAADLAGSYMYPAMARVFRTGGIQIATMFCYDPLAIASNNTEYQTHFMNLVYTPQKAVSLTIAAEAFRILPRGKSYGSYPANNSFGPCRVSYEKDLSEFVSRFKFFYSNDTETKPYDTGQLEHIIGCGSSQVVQYEGTGAYFLDKLEKGVWRLEIYPDVLWVHDPFAATRLNREVARLIWRQWFMKINLPDLGPSFSVSPLNSDNTFQATAEGGRFPVRPGVYLLVQKGLELSHLNASAFHGHMRLDEFSSPRETKIATAVLHQPPREIVAGRPLEIRAQVVTSDDPKQVILRIHKPNTGTFTSLMMKPVKNYQYSAEIPQKHIELGTLEYSIVVEGKSATYSFPEATLWAVPVIDKSAPVSLFDASRDQTKLYFPNVEHSVKFSTQTVNGMTKNHQALHINVPSFKAEPHDVSFRYVFDQELETRRCDLESFQYVHLRVRAGEETTTHFEIVLIEQDGTAWGAKIPLSKEWREIRIPLEKFAPTTVARLPRPYPSIFRYWEDIPSGRGVEADHISLKTLRSVQFSMGSRFFPEYGDKPHAFELESAELVIGSK